MIARNKTATYVFFENIQLYYATILVPLGLLGNCLSIYVFFGPRLRHSSSSIYLGALSISDSGFLVTIFVVWLNMLQVHLFNESGFCQLFTYLSTFFSCLSVWLVVAFTVERYVAVRYPLRRQVLCTVTRAKITVIVLTSLASLFSSPVIMFSESHKISTQEENITRCELADDWKFSATIYNNIDILLTFAVPLTILVIFNTLIARNIYKLGNVRRTLTIESDVPSGKDVCAHNPRNRMPQVKVTKMLLIVSSAFLCLNMPAFVLRIFAFYHPSESDEIIIAQQIGHMLFYTSFGINFILYCTSGQNFRREIVRMFKYFRNAKRSETLIQMTSHEKQCELTRGWSSSKRLHVDNSRRKDPQETQKLPING